ncbi:MAG TPA: 50S ribosomal protein L11 methyltransferase [Thermomicrobiales bacterium]|nr:50S ribosomal protein L11 methyltransferase [Thermomicrobiales bacterium]
MIEQHHAAGPPHLASLGPLVVDRFALPGTDDIVSIVRPGDIDRLLDSAAGDPEQNLPYWAELWPSGIALAAAIARQPDELRGVRCLELGCGLGVTALAAVRAGADLLATDYAPPALALCRHNCLVNTGREPETLAMNWRRPSNQLRTRAGPGYPVVLAADVLYERRDIDPLLDLIDWLVAPDGVFWLAEPGRPPAAAFLEQAAERGWSGEIETIAGPWPDPHDRDVVVRAHRLRR